MTNQHCNSTDVINTVNDWIGILLGMDISNIRPEETHQPQFNNSNNETTVKTPKDSNNKSSTAVTLTPSTTTQNPSKTKDYLLCASIERCQKNRVLIVDLAKNFQTHFTDLLDSLQSHSYRDSTIYCLALALAADTVSVAVKQAIRPRVSAICHNDIDFFDFVQCFTVARSSLGKFNRPFRRLLHEFYANKTPEELAESLAITTKIHGWTHKDLIKYAHLKFEDALKSKLIQCYMFNKWDTLSKSTDPETLQLFQIIQRRRRLRSTKDLNVAVDLIKELKATHLHVNPEILRNDVIWAAILPQLSLAEILQLLLRFYQLGLLKPEMVTYRKCVEMITDPKLIKENGLHPVEAMIKLKYFEKGGRPLKPHFVDYLLTKNMKKGQQPRMANRNEPKCPHIIEHVKKCIDLSFVNVTSLNKTFMITIDISGEATTCMNNRNFSTKEAAYILANYFLRTEATVIVAVFVNHQILKINLTKNDTFTVFLEKIKMVNSQFIIPSVPLKWAYNKREKIDVFINVMRSDYISKIPYEFRTKSGSQKIIRPTFRLQKYRKGMKCSSVKYIRVFLDNVRLDSEINTLKTLNIVGFSARIFKVINDFCCCRIENVLFENRLKHYIFAE